MWDKRVPTITCADAVQAFRRDGWAVDRTTGSHTILKKDGEPLHLTLPDHGGKSLGKGLLKRQIANAGPTVEEFNDLRDNEEVEEEVARLRELTPNCTSTESRATFDQRSPVPYNTRSNLRVEPRRVRAVLAYAIPGRVSHPSKGGLGSASEISSIHFQGGQPTMSLLEDERAFQQLMAEYLEASRQLDRDGILPLSELLDGPMADLVLPDHRPSGTETDPMDNSALVDAVRGTEMDPMDDSALVDAVRGTEMDPIDDSALVDAARGTEMDPMHSVETRRSTRLCAPHMPESDLNLFLRQHAADTAGDRIAPPVDDDALIRRYFVIRQALWTWPELQALSRTAMIVLAIVIEIARERGFPGWIALSSRELRPLARLGKNTVKEATRALRHVSITRPGRIIYPIGSVRNPTLAPRADPSEPARLIPQRIVLWRPGRPKSPRARWKLNENLLLGAGAVPPEFIASEGCEDGR